MKRRDPRPRPSDAALDALADALLALRTPAEVRAFLDDLCTPAELEAIFAPQFPITLPSFARNPLQTSGGAGAAGYIDVGFEVTRQLALLELSLAEQRKWPLQRYLGQ